MKSFVVLRDFTSKLSFIGIFREIKIVNTSEYSNIIIGISKQKKGKNPYALLCDGREGYVRI
jgi:hypothetical protein